MYVCICQGVKERQIRQEINRGATCYEDIQLALEVGVCCGQCEDTTRAVISESLNQHHALEAVCHYHPLEQTA